MRRKQKSRDPLVTSVASVVKNAIDTRPFTTDEVRAEKREMYKVLKDSFAVYIENLKNGSVEIDSSLDLDRLIKGMMLVMGEPDGVPPTEETQTVVTFSEPLSLDDPDVKSVYERLTESYNSHNDEAAEP